MLAAGEASTHGRISAASLERRARRSSAGHPRALTRQLHYRSVYSRPSTSTTFEQRFRRISDLRSLFRGDEAILWPCLARRLTTMRQAAPEIIGRQAAPETMARQAAPETMARQAAPQTMARQAAPGDNGTPGGPGDNGTPGGPGDNGTPGGRGDNGTPGGPGDNGTPGGPEDSDICPTGMARRTVLG
jgi:hypothetical protein